MRVTVKGKHSAEDFTTADIKKAIEFFCNILFSFDENEDQLPRVHVEVLLLSEDKLRVDGEGFPCDASTAICDDVLRPSDFRIEINRDFTRIKLFTALAHECVHVKQLTLGEKQQSLRGDKQRWMGMLIDIATRDYYDLPWEVEAHGRERGLWIRFRDKMGWGKKK